MINIPTKIFKKNHNLIFILGLIHINEIILIIIINKIKDENRHFFFYYDKKV